MTRLAKIVKGVGALILLAALVAGIPWALWHFIGWPLPHHVPSTAQVGYALNRQGIPAQTLVDALAVVVWLTWATLIASLAVEIPAALSGRRPPHLPVAGLFQPVTGRLVAAVIVACLILAPALPTADQPAPPARASLWPGARSLRSSSTTRSSPLPSSPPHPSLLRPPRPPVPVRHRRRPSRRGRPPTLCSGATPSGASLNASSATRSAGPRSTNSTKDAPNRAGPRSPTRTGSTPAGPFSSQPRPCPRRQHRQRPHPRRRPPLRPRPRRPTTHPVAPPPRCHRRPAYRHQAEVIEAARKASGLDVEPELVDRRPGDPPALDADNRRARELLGWSPRYGLDAIVDSAWLWHSIHPDGYGS